MMKSARIFLALLALVSLVALGVFSFGRTTALASFVINSWQGYKLTSGLVGYWSFDGQDMDLASSTREVYDRSGNNNHGDWVNHATTTVIGKIGQALNVDGSDDSVNAGSASVLDDIINITTCAWIKPESIPSTWSGFMSKGWEFEILNEGAGNRLGFYLPFGAGASWASPLNSIVFNVWQHVCATYNNSSTANDAMLYINGAPVTVTELTTPDGTPASNASADLFIGRYSGGGEFYDGSIDDVRVYNRILSADEIKRLYLMGASLKVNVSHRDELTANESGRYFTFDGRDMDLSSSTAEVRGIAGGVILGDTGDWKNHATTTTIGKIGQGIQFDGVDDYIDFGDDIAYDFNDTAAFTFAGWFYRDTQSTADTVIFKRQGILAAQPGYGAYITSISDQLNFEVSDGTDEYSLDSVTTFKNPGWYHFAIVWDPASAANTEIYINGVDDNAADTGTIGNIGDLSNSRVLAIGAQSDGTNNFVGKLDDFRLYRRVLSPDEIKRLYLMGASMNVNVSHRDELTSGLVGYWTFDGKNMDLSSSTKEIYDASGNNNDGDWREHATTTVIGKIGQGIDLDGVDDYVLLSAAPVAQAPLSVCLWFKSNAIAGGTYGLFSIEFSAAHYHSLYISGSPISLHAASRAGIVAEASSSISPVQPNEWNFACVVWESSASRQVFLNGVAGSVETSTRAPSSLISAKIGLTNSVFTGVIDEVRVYSRALSADEIKRLYLMGK